MVEDVLDHVVASLDVAHRVKRCDPRHVVSLVGETSRWVTQAEKAMESTTDGFLDA